MKTFSASVLFATSLLVSFGCENFGEKVQTVDWYKEHKNERIAVIKKCNENPGELAATPNCINAGRAASAITWGSRGVITAKPMTKEDFTKK